MIMTWDNSHVADKLFTKTPISNCSPTAFQINTARFLNLYPVKYLNVFSFEFVHYVCQYKWWTIWKMKSIKNVKFYITSKIKRTERAVTLGTKYYIELITSAKKLNHWIKVSNSVVFSIICSLLWYLLELMSSRFASESRIHWSEKSLSKLHDRFIWIH